MIRTKAALLILTVGGCAALAAGQQTTESFHGGPPGGASLYRTYCASCHGTEAKGDGPLSGSLRTVPPDLTRLAKRNEGTFDRKKVHRIIDGRNPVKGHGGPDMPVWGDALKRSGDRSTDKAVETRIDALVTHLESLQAK